MQRRTPAIVRAADRIARSGCTRNRGLPISNLQHARAPRFRTLPPFPASLTMLESFQTSLDLVEELRLRRWARLHYAPAEERDPAWHPIILQEMDHKEQELSEDASHVGRYVPLAPHRPASHQRHVLAAPRFLAMPARADELHYT
jgi:hypothetical protein